MKRIINNIMYSLFGHTPYPVQKQSHKTTFKTIVPPGYVANNWGYNLWINSVFSQLKK